MYSLIYLCTFNTISPGNVTSGKTSLIDKLCQVSKTKVQNTNGVKLNGCSLEYRYIDVRDEDIEGKSSHPTCLPALVYVIC